MCRRRSARRPPRVEKHDAHREQGSRHAGAREKRAPAVQPVYDGAALRRVWAMNRVEATICRTRFSDSG